MVQLLSQNEGKKPRVGQLREMQAESSSSCIESFCTRTHITLSHTLHTHPLHIHCTLLTPSHIHLAHVRVHLGTLHACLPHLIYTHWYIQTTLSHTCAPPTHTPSRRPPPHKASQGAQGVAQPSWWDASLSCAPHTRTEGGTGGSLRQSYHVQELQEGRTAREREDCPHHRHGP